MKRASFLMIWVNKYRLVQTTLNKITIQNSRHLRWWDESVQLLSTFQFFFSHYLHICIGYMLYEAYECNKGNNWKWQTEADQSCSDNPKVKVMIKLYRTITGVDVKCQRHCAGGRRAHQLRNTAEDNGLFISFYEADSWNTLSIVHTFDAWNKVSP